MKKNLLAITMFMIIIFFIFGIIVYKSDILPKMGTDFSEQLKHESESKTLSTTSNRTKTISENQILENEDFTFLVESSIISKKINHLNHVDPKYYVLSDVEVDGDNTFLDNHSYLEIGVTITNTKDSDYTIELANISLFTEKEQELFNVTDISLTSTTKDIEKKESFKLTLKPQERKKIYLGYVLLDSEYDSLKDNLYILPDLNGVVAMDPQYLTKAKLDIKEN